MAQKSIRQLAKQHNVDIQLLMEALGAKSGADTIEEDDPRLQAFIQAAPSSPPTDTPQATSQTEHPLFNGMVEEVETAFYENLDTTALVMRLKGQLYLSGKVNQYMGISAEAALELLNKKNKATAEQNQQPAPADITQEQISFFPTIQHQYQRLLTAN